MKKLSILLAGCLMSLAMMAEMIPGILSYTHDVTEESDPYTCLSVNPVTLYSTLRSPGKVFIYEVTENGNDIQIYSGDGDVEYDVNPYVGQHTYRVDAYYSRQIMPGSGPVYPDQYDVFNVTVKYHVEEHHVTVNADLITNMGEFEVYTTAGAEDPKTGNMFCDQVDFKCAVNPGRSEDVSNAQIINFDVTKIPELFPLGPLSVGTHVYSVYMVSREGYIRWCDRFFINVVAPTCKSGLVYRKWDDFMFVDNGVGGGNSTFVSYQWYREGQKIEGATEQWYRTTLPQYENAMPSGRYYVRIIDNAGNEIVTCPKYFNDLPASTSHNPHGSVGAPRKLLRDGELVVEYDGRVYNAQGERIQ